MKEALKEALEVIGELACSAAVYLVLIGGVTAFVVWIAKLVWQI